MDSSNVIRIIVFTLVDSSKLWVLVETENWENKLPVKVFVASISSIRNDSEKWIAESNCSVWEFSLNRTRCFTLSIDHGWDQELRWTPLPCLLSSHSKKTEKSDHRTFVHSGRFRLSLFIKRHSDLLADIRGEISCPSQFHRTTCPSKYTTLELTVVVGFSTCERLLMRNRFVLKLLWKI